MKNTHNKLTCLFGHHDYSERLIESGDGGRWNVYLCGVCRRSGYIKWDDGAECWYDYSEEVTIDKEGWGVYLCKICGRSAYRRWEENRIWLDYDAEGNRIHMMYPNFCEVWKTNDRGWVRKKPENWKHEKETY